MDGQGHRELVGDRRTDDRLVVVDGGPQPLDHRRTQHVGLAGIQGVAPLERRQLGGVQDLVGPGPSDAGQDPLVPEHRVQGPGVVEEVLQRRWVRPGLRTELRHVRLGLQVGGTEELRPGGLPGPELPEPQLAAVGQPDREAQRPVLERARLVVELQPARRHQVHEQQEIAVEADDQQLGPPAHAGERVTPQLAERRVEGLEGAHTLGERRLDDAPGQRGAEAAHHDLDLGELGHGPPPIPTGRGRPTPGPRGGCGACPVAPHRWRRRCGRRRQASRTVTHAGRAR